MADCPCNNYPGPTGAANCVCGPFEEPTVKDTGRCHSYRVKRDCEAPVVPAIQCEDDTFEVISTPDLIPPFRIRTVLRDSNCDIITDNEGDPIFTTIT